MYNLRERLGKETYPDMRANSARMHFQGYCGRRRPLFPYESFGVPRTARSCWVGSSCVAKGCTQPRWVSSLEIVQAQEAAGRRRNRGHAGEEAVKQQCWRCST